MDPETFQPRRGIMTRYGRKLLEDGAKYYQKINVQSPAEYYKAINVKNIETEYKVSMGTKNE